MWLPTMKWKASRESLPSYKVRDDIKHKKSNPAGFLVKENQSKLQTVFKSSLTSSASVSLGSPVSPFATVSRKKMPQNIDVCGLYESYFGDNDSVASLPISMDSSLPRPEYKQPSASMPKLTTLPGDGGGDSLFAVEDPSDIFAFLDEYDTEEHDEYFLPTRVEDKAVKNWTKLEESGDYAWFEFANDFKAKPVCLNIGDDKLSHTGHNSHSQNQTDVSAWF